MWPDDQTFKEMHARDKSAKSFQQLAVDSEKGKMLTLYEQFFHRVAIIWVILFVGREGGQKLENEEFFSGFDQIWENKI